MGGKPKAPPKPDPATLAVGVDDIARKQAELERRRRGGYYSGFRSQMGGNMSVGGMNPANSEQTLG